MLERRENQDLLFGDHDDRLTDFCQLSQSPRLISDSCSSGYRFPSSGRYLPDSSELLDLHLIGQSVDFHHINRRAPLGAPKKKPSFQRKTAQCSKLPVFYFRIAKTATPTQVRTALNSSEKSTERLKSNSQLRHNCPNTMRK